MSGLILMPVKADRWKASWITLPPKYSPQNKHSFQHISVPKKEQATLQEKHYCRMQSHDHPSHAHPCIWHQPTERVHKSRWTTIWFCLMHCNQTQPTSVGDINQTHKDWLHCELNGLWKSVYIHKKKLEGVFHQHAYQKIKVYLIILQLRKLLEVESLYLQSAGFENASLFAPFPPNRTSLHHLNGFFPMHFSPLRWLRQRFPPRGCNTFRKLRPVRQLQVIMK